VEFIERMQSSERLCIKRDASISGSDSVAKDVLRSIVKYAAANFRWRSRAVCHQLQYKRRKIIEHLVSDGGRLLPQ
jgi:hypothetical protein